MTSVLSEGQALGEFEILSVAGIGGMGIVYRARQRSLDRVVALKVIRDEIAETSEYRQRFMREAHLAASVDHPHIVSVFDVGDFDGRLVLAMQWVQGENLRNALGSTGGLPPDRAVQVLTQVAGALDAVHGVAGLVHRDIKPSNVLIRKVGGSDHAYLTDFGVAKRSDSAADLTATGMVVGTVDYMAPEQITGGRTDARTDVYALGCVFFEMLSGRVPYERENSVAKLFAHVSDPPPRLQGPLGDLYPAFGSVLAKAMAKDPGERYLSAGDLARDARAALQGMRYTGPPTIVGVGEAEPEAPGQSGAGGQAAVLDAGQLEALRRAMAQTRTVADTPSDATPPTAPAPTRPEPLPQAHSPAAGGPRTPVYPVGPQTPPYQPGYPPVMYPGYGPPPAPARKARPLGLILLALVAVAGIAAAVLIATGVFSHHASTGTAASSQTAQGHSKKSSPGSPPKTPNAVPQAQQYNGTAFSMSYPAGWQLQDAEQNKGSYTDTTFASPSDSNSLIRVDYSPNPPADPMAAARPVITALQRQPGYRQLGLNRGTFEGYPAVRWRFLVLESGILLEKEDVFITASGKSLGFGLLTQATANQYASLASEFAKLRRTLVIK